LGNRLFGTFHDLRRGSVTIYPCSQDLIVKTNGKEMLIHIVSEKYAAKRHKIPVMQKVQKRLLVLNQKTQLKIFTGIRKKHPSGIPQQINNSEGWYQNVSLGGNVCIRH